MDILKNHRFVYYQDENFYYFWKPAGLPSTRWKKYSFLDFMNDDNYNISIQNIVQSQKAFFWEEKEFWLLNRLDNDTSWILYFAKNLKIYNKFREYQKNMMIDKYYITQVYGNIHNRTDKNSTLISYPIMHHKFSEDRMIVIKTADDIKKWKWKEHLASTAIEEVEYNNTENISTVVIKIHKWIRHQIRAHLSSIGYPIIWDSIYCKNKNHHKIKLQLFSIGIKYQNKK